MTFTFLAFMLQKGLCWIASDYQRLLAPQGAKTFFNGKEFRFSVFQKASSRYHNSKHKHLKINAFNAYAHAYVHTFEAYV